jgi:glutathione synthase/RimK-type ligase-like ATP-grasp enzyme
MKKGKAVRTLGSKWIKTKVLQKSKSLRSYVPETKLFSHSSLLTMLQKHKMVYVKPTNGSAGHGVIRAELKKQDGSILYQYQSGMKKRTFHTFNQFFISMNQTKLKRTYLIQQGIHLLQKDKRPFDVRIMVQRTSGSPWKVTGVIGRLAHPKKIVTNYHSQGKPLSLGLLLSPYLQGSKKQTYKATLQKLGVRIAKHYQKTYPGFREIGVDIGIGPNLHPWVLEVNTSPDPFIFNQLKNKKMFRTVLKYAKANGRFR